VPLIQRPPPGCSERAKSEQDEALALARMTPKQSASRRRRAVGLLDGCRPDLVRRPHSNKRAAAPAGYTGDAAPHAGAVRNEKISLLKLGPRRRPNWWPAFFTPGAAAPVVT
jgi:cation diffusion facilitator CzcD-associated flavoprotein CzcO